MPPIDSLDLYLVTALVAQESTFQPDVTIVGQRRRPDATAAFDGPAVCAEGRCAAASRRRR